MKRTRQNRLIANTFWMLLRNIVCIVAGILLWIYPTEFANGVVIGVGILLIFYAIVAFLISRFYRSVFINSGIINAIVSLAAGLALVFAPAFFAKWFVTGIAILIVCLSVLQLIEIISLRRFKPAASGLWFLSPLILLAIGIVTLVKQHELINLVGYFCAAALIYTGLSGLILTFRLRAVRKRIEQAEQEAQATILASATAAPKETALTNTAPADITLTEENPTETASEEVRPEAAPEEVKPTETARGNVSSTYFSSPYTTSTYTTKGNAGENDTPHNNE